MKTFDRMSAFFSAEEEVVLPVFFENSDYVVDGGFIICATMKVIMPIINDRTIKVPFTPSLVITNFFNGAKSTAI